MKWLMDYPWPGNVRELRHAIEHAFVTVGGDHLTLLDLPPEIRQAKASADPASTTSHFTKEEEVEREEIARALQQSGGHRTKAAKQLGYSRVTLWKKMRRFGARYRHAFLSGMGTPRLVSRQHFQRSRSFWLRGKRFVSVRV